MPFTEWSHATGEHDARYDDDGTDENKPPKRFDKLYESQRMQWQSQQRADDDGGALTSEPKSSPPLSMAWCRSLPLAASVDIADNRVFHMRLRRLSQYYYDVFLFFVFHTVCTCVYISLHCVSSLRPPHCVLQQNTRHSMNASIQGFLVFCYQKNRHQCIDLGVRAVRHVELLAKTRTEQVVQHLCSVFRP